MSATKRNSIQSKPLPIENALKEMTQPMVSSVSRGPSTEAKPESKSLSLDVAEQLLFLMKEVTKQSVDPKSVNAACNCATQMINLMKLTLKLRDM